VAAGQWSGFGPAAGQWSGFGAYPVATVVGRPWDNH